MAYAWVAVEASTGNVIADLPLLDCSSVAVTIGGSTSTQATLPIPQAPENWERATEPGATIMILLDVSSDPNGVPIWGGLVLTRQRDEGYTVTMQLATLEAYWDRRYVGNQTFSQTNQDTIVTTLINAYAVAGSDGGIPFTVQLVTPGTVTLRDRTYSDLDDKTLLSDLQELMGVNGGPEFTIGWTSAFNNGIRAITPVVMVGTRIGTDPLPGLTPNAVFELSEYRDANNNIVNSGGNIESFTYTEDWSSQGGANDVLATSTANADSRPQSTHVVVPDPDRPTYEYRFTPSTSITDIPTLQAHAQAEANIISQGVNTLEVTGVVSSAPALNIDWFLGDTVGYNIQTSSFPEGLSGNARAIGWKLALTDLPTITPTLSL